MKKKNSDIEFYREALASMQQQKAAYAEENRALREELRVMSESYRQENEGLRQLMESMRLTILDQTKSIQELTESNKNLMEQLKNALANAKLSRGKRFAPTTEQSNLLNNRRTDYRAEEKDKFDGNPPSASQSSSDGSDTTVTPNVREKKKSRGRKPAKEAYDCDETIVHPLGSYFNLPEGAYFKTCNGHVETHRYECYEYIQARIIKHVYETATYIDSIGDSHNTLPQEMRHNPVKGCPFSAEMLAFILIEKYATHTPKNRIKQKLRDIGAKFSKTTFTRYYQLSEKALRDMMESVFRKTIVDCDYLMIDETCELVGVVNPKTNITEFFKKYLWAFHDKKRKLVWYLYEHGSRSRKVVGNVLDNFKGIISTDGYAAYTAFGDEEKYPDLTRAGCWAHPRRYFIEALEAAHDVCRKVIDDIDKLFANDRLFSGMNDEERGKNRRKHSLPIFNRILSYVKRVASNAELMGISLLNKAVSYFINQSKALRNAILNGTAELSNNLCEQRMKPIKLSLKNCQNIGSESAAENAAFMHSLIESCRLNNKNPYDYLCSLFRKMRTPIDDIGKRELLPDRWVPEC